MTFGQGGNCGLRMSVYGKPNAHLRSAPVQASRTQVSCEIKFPGPINYKAHRPEDSNSSTESSREATPPYTHPSPPLGPVAISRRSPLRPYSPSLPGRNVNKTDFSVASVSSTSKTSYIFMDPTTPADFLASSPTSSPPDHTCLLDNFDPEIRIPALKISATLVYLNGSGQMQTNIVPLSDDKRLLLEQLELLQKFIIWKKSPVGLKSDVTYQQYVNILDNEVPKVV
ncbi:hypothetical protein AOQ84DRAFT_361875 [Glonium stellatum]|uniref:Uncharacterized protein n=1 Tax=Glonium stellatum TaxID=574774 RepID=A0A8E2F5P8_9PEZI|nr:hypothetical protein AOQ84DRAFT_361875 [Glonium stellatum]